MRYEGDLIRVVREATAWDAPENPGAASQESALFRSLVGRSAGICRIRSLIERVAPGDSPVLLLGQTGTGKEVVARNIHYLSSRRNAPFSAVNCAAIPPDLFESELFGHDRGAFTGALTDRKGRFELANGGTLFLDEIGDMPLDLQVKLLRVLEEQCFNRIGGATRIDVDVRIIAATHRDLEAMIRDGDFREDLYYRLNVVPIAMPLLKDRREDIPLLISEVNARLRARGFSAKEVSDEALKALIAYEWPGNVRELANIMERCSNLVAGGEIELSDLPERIRIAAHGSTDEMPILVWPAGAGSGAHVFDFEHIEMKGLLELLEASLIRQALDKSDGVVAQAAHRLGMRRTTLIDKIQKFDIKRPSADSSES